VFYIYLSTNSNLCHLQHKLTGFCNRDKKCLQRGTDWGYKWSGLGLGFKGLMSFLTQSNLLVFSNNKPKQKYKVMLNAHSSINIVFLTSNIPGRGSFGILFSYEWQLAATVWRQSDDGTVSGSSSTINITFGLIYIVDREWRKLQN